MNTAMPTDPYAAAIYTAKEVLLQTLMAQGLTGATIALIMARHTQVHDALTAYQEALRAAFSAQTARYAGLLATGPGQKDTP